MTKKVKRVILLGVISILACLMGLFGLLSSQSNNTLAESINGVTFESGASFRANEDSLGIRFKAKIDQSTANMLFNYENDKISSYKNANYKVGMIIAPIEAYDIPEGNVYSESKDYLGYILDTVNGLGREKENVAVDFTFEDNNFAQNSDGTVNVRGALVQLKDINLNNKYKAVVYYTLDGVNYQYSGFSDVTMIADLADETLNGDMSEIDPDVIEDIYGIVANTVSMRDVGQPATYNAFTGTYTVTVNDYELLMNKELEVESLAKSVDFDYTLTNKTGSVALSNGKLKATGECSGKLNLSSYDGKIQYVYNLVNEPILRIITQSGGEAVTSYNIVCDLTGTTNPNVTKANGKQLGGFLNEGLYLAKGWGHGKNYTSPKGGVNTYFEVDLFKRYDSPSKYKSTDKYIVIGNCAYSRLAGLPDYEGKTPNDFKITVKDNSIFLQGNVSSLRFAVYKLLNIMIGYEKISLKTTGLDAEILVNDKDEVVLGKSEIECEFNYDIPYSIGFSAGAIYAQTQGAWVDTNASMGYTFSAELGDGSNYNDDGSGNHNYQITGIHNALGYFPYARYSTTHPEWYAQKSDGNGGYVINTTQRSDNAGTRTEATQLCYYGLYNSTNDEAVDIAMNVVNRYNSSNAISFSNMDNGGFCACEHCKNGNACYWYFMFLNKLADAMQADEDTDHMKIKALVYGNIINQAPLDNDGNPRVVLRDNIMIQFAYNYGDFYSGLSELDRALLDQWSKFTTEAGLMFWLYCAKTNYGMFFFDDFTNMQEKYQYLYSIGTQYVEDEGVKAAPAYTNFGNLRVYLESNVAKDVDCDYEGLTDKFFDNYFGAGSEKMREVFDKQRSLQQNALDNWEEMWHEGYDLIPAGSKTQASITNSVGNNLIGTYSSNTFHYYVANGFHGNRYLLSLISPKAELEYMLKKVNGAISSIATSDITTERKELLVKRILLEKIALIYQYCFIYDDNFSVGNSSYQIAQGTTKANAPQVLSTADLQKYLGCSSMNEVKAMFYQLCKYFGFSSVNYKSLTSDSSSYKSIYTTWSLSTNDEANEDNATWIGNYLYDLTHPRTYQITYVLNGGTNDPANPTSYVSNGDEITLKDPIRVGYTFAGWAEGNKIYEGSTGDKVFTATWEIVIETEVIADLKDGININAMLASAGLGTDDGVTTVKFGGASYDVVNGAVSFGAVENMTDAIKMLPKEEAYTLELNASGVKYTFTDFKLYSILVSNADEYDMAHSFQTSEGYTANGGKEYWAVIGFDADVQLNAFTSTTILGPSSNSTGHGFRGIIDGRNHKITGFDAVTNATQGFAKTAWNAKLKNIDITTAKFNTSGILGGQWSRGLIFENVTIRTGINSFSGNSGFLLYDFMGSSDFVFKNLTVISSSTSSAIANCARQWIGSPYATNTSNKFTGKIVVDNVNFVQAGPSYRMKIFNGINFAYGTEHSSGFGDAIVLAPGATKGITIYNSESDYNKGINGIEVTSKVIDTPINATANNPLTVNTLIDEGKTFLYATSYIGGSTTNATNVLKNASTITYTTEGTYKLLVVDDDYVNYIYTVNVGTNYNITYVLNGGDNAPSNPSEYSSVMTSDIVLNDPTRVGYEFIGWTEGNVITAGSTGDKTFTANWQLITYNVTYVMNGGTNNPNNPDEYTIESEDIVLLDPTRNGYTFTGWIEGDTIEAGSTGDKTFTANWEAIAYNITYVMNGGTNNPNNPDEYTIESETIVLGDPTKDGYEFLGWTEGDTIEAGSTGDKTFTANWDLITYNITYVMNGGTNNPNNPDEYTIESGEIVLQDPTKNGFVFYGWTEGDTIEAGSTGDKTFTANWSVVTYNVSYVLNGGTNNPANPSTYSSNIESDIVLQAPTKNGYTFTGWTEGDTIAVGSTGDKTFTATWEITVYSIIYDLGDGTNNPNNPTTYTIESGEIVLQDPTCEGNEFLGWAEGDTIEAGSTGDKTFTAIWKYVQIGKDDGKIIADEPWDFD